jgi:hypothetical protein
LVADGDKFNSLFNDMKIEVKQMQKLGWSRQRIRYHVNKCSLCNGSGVIYIPNLIKRQYNEKGEYVQDLGHYEPCKCKSKK